MGSTKGHAKQEKKIYFYTPPQTTKRLLYYPIVAGRYHSDQNYRVERDRYDSILALCVIDGSMILEQNGHTFVANEGELLLVDCYVPHKYYTDSHATTVWVHFDGADSRSWFRELTKRSQVLRADIECIDLISAIIEGIKTSVNEYRLSNLIYSLLCTLSCTEAPQGVDATDACIKDAREFVQKNMDRELSVAEIAASVHFSAPYFSKIFKEATGFSPYDYLTNVRIEQAKKLLIQTSFPISLIACRVGFQSTENFIYCFKKRTGISPLKFRKLSF